MLTFNELTNSNDFFVIAGPCVIESEEHVLMMAKELKEITEKLGVKLVFKASFDKANRTSINSYRGVGIKEGMRILNEVKKQYDLPILTDIHEPCQADIVKNVIDIIQIPAFLCRQTDMLKACAETGRIINIKKGQFCSHITMKHAVEKCHHFGNKNIIVTDRGTMFGYEDLIVDFRNIPLMKKECKESLVVMDCTHSLQQPNKSDKTIGLREFIPLICKCAIVSGCHGLFMEIHDDPENALSDSATQFNLNGFKTLLKRLIRLKEVEVECENIN